MHGFAGDRWRELSPYLDRALDLSGEARTVWLEELRAQERCRGRDTAVAERKARYRQGAVPGRCFRVDPKLGIACRTGDRSLYIRIAAWPGRDG